MILLRHAAGKIIIGKLSFLFLLLIPFIAFPQITEYIAERNFYDFTIRSEKKSADPNTLLVVRISKNKETVISDSVLTDLKTCAGFSVPEIQPFKDYFIFSKQIGR